MRLATGTHTWSPGFASFAWVQERFQAFLAFLEGEFACQNLLFYRAATAWTRGVATRTRGDNVELLQNICKVRCVFLGTTTHIYTHVL